MSSTKNLALPSGYQLQDYKIDKVLSSGGFSFVYLAHDKDNKLVAIKEYLYRGRCRHGVAPGTGPRAAGLQPARRGDGG